MNLRYMLMEKNKTILDSTMLDAKTDNKFSSGIKIVYKSKIYNYYGYSQVKGYIVISTAMLEEGFVIGDIFNHSIPVGISHFPLKQNLYYKKINPSDVEDYYDIIHKSEYSGYKCHCSVYYTGYVKVVIDAINFSGHVLPSDVEIQLLNQGFSSFYDGDNSWDYRKIYVNDKILLSDENLKLSCVKKFFEYPYPFDEMRCKKDENMEDIDLKSLYVELCK